MKRFLSLIVTLTLLQGCASLPPELLYAEPTGEATPKATVIGSRSEELLFYSSLRLIGIDDKYVRSANGVSYKKAVHLLPGERELFVEYSQGAEYYGRGFITFTAEAGKSYRVQHDDEPIFESSSSEEVASVTDTGAVTEKSEEPESAETASESENPQPVPENNTYQQFGVMWVEDLDTGEAVTDKIRFEIIYVPTVVVPIFI